jgi:hypothetical protein
VRDRAAALQLTLADKRDLHLTIRELAEQRELRRLSATTPSG